MGGRRGGGEKKKTLLTSTKVPPTEVGFNSDCLKQEKQDCLARFRPPSECLSAFFLNAVFPGAALMKCFFFLIKRIDVDRTEVVTNTRDQRDGG